jgi:putative membrane protein
MRSLFYAASLAALLAAGPALAQNQNAQNADKRFIDHVARDGQAEVELAQLAEKKGVSPQVKALAQHLAADHTKANQQLQQIAQKEGVKVPQGAEKEKSATLTKLEKLNGAAFDRAFLEEQVQDHQKDIQFFQHEATTLQNPQLKSFAQQTLPVLQRHLQMAQQAEAQMGSGSSVKGSSGSTR